MVAYPHQVGLHLSCHGQRGLHQANESGLTPMRAGQLHRLLAGRNGLTLSKLDRNGHLHNCGTSFVAR